jgi:hypothetical protein
MINTSGLSPLQSTPPTKSCIEDFTSLTALYEDIAQHLFFSPAAAQSTRGDTGPAGPKGDDGDKGDKGDKGDTGEQGPSNYTAWIALGNTGTEQDFFDTLKGDKGDTPTISDAKQVNIANGAAFSDVQGKIGMSVLTVTYDDSTGDPQTMVPPALVGVGPTIDLLNGYVRVYFTTPPTDGNYKLVSSFFAS